MDKELTVMKQIQLHFKELTEDERRHILEWAWSKFYPQEKETVGEFLVQWLRMNHYDGLYNECMECCCELADLVPCYADFTECKPGYRRTPTQEEISERGELEWVIGPREEG